MLQIQDVSKTYVTGGLEQRALDHVSFNLRDNEFVAVLGPSGSGKTTLLNVIGGLDRYDSGDLVIDRVSTKRYMDRDWDSYRNHTVGFVFQSYNLIPHQSVLANVELALTISGVGRAERRERAMRALEQVGLADQAHKRPNQMSGGQMQRVAIARALVNDPRVLLADEPTGALDSETSLQVMELLKEVAADRLVVLVTHNEELAERYATRIVTLRDGRVTGDTDPYEPERTALPPTEHRNLGRASMSFSTALGLSFNNLRSKLARTLLTAFAGSIGIIGIALILSLSTGVSDYVDEIQRSTMVSYPISIDAESIDLSSVLEAGRTSSSSTSDHDDDAVYADTSDITLASQTSLSVSENNLTAFKEYLDDEESEIWDYIGDYGVVYSYDVSFSVYAYDPDGVLVSADGVTIGEEDSESDTMSAMMSSMSSLLGTSSSVPDSFDEMLAGTDGELVGTAVTDSYDLLAGAWPTSYDEVVLVLDENGEVDLTTLYELGLLPSADYEELMAALDAGEEVELDETSLSYDEVVGHTLYLIAACDSYVENEDGTFSLVGGSAEAVEGLLRSAVELTIVGIVSPAEDATAANLSGAIGYTSALAEYVIEHTAESAVVLAQEASPEVSVLNGLSFSVDDDETKAADALAYLSGLSESEKAELCREILQSVYDDDPDAVSAMLAMSDEELAATLDELLLANDAETDTSMLVGIYDSYVSVGTYDENMSAFGVVNLDAPSSISIYADSFEDKEAIVDCIEAYNESASEEDQISYTDYVGLLMSSVTTIVNVISYVLIAFVAVSLVVSSIMIGIITYISVLERTKEIGVLRAMGASKRNISQVFNAETFIVGLCSGLIGVGATLLVLIPANALIHAVLGTQAVSAALPVTSAVALVVLSVVLTVIAGLLPAGKAAKKDPVAALRTE